MRRFATTLLLLLLSCFGFANGQTRQRYVRPNDQVSINCDEEPAISKQYTVSKDGFVIMQYVGAVQIAGLTEESAATKIGQALVNERILSEATVSVQVLSSQQGVVSYSGAVGNSGSIAPAAGMRISDVVKLAQPTPRANMQRLRIVTAAGHEFVVNFIAFNGTNMVNNPQVLPGDSVFFDALPAPPTIQPTPAPINVPSGPVYHPARPVPLPSQGSNGQLQTFVMVLGAVATPQYVPFQPGMTLTQAINAAGGLLKTSDANDVSIKRKMDGQQHVFKANLSDINRGFAGDISLKPGDVVEVPSRHHDHGLSPLEKVGGLLLLGLILFH